MHIPDGYLSPATCAVMYAGAAPFWYLVFGIAACQALAAHAVGAAAFSFRGVFVRGDDV